MGDRVLSAWVGKEGASIHFATYSYTDLNGYFIISFTIQIIVKENLICTRQFPIKISSLNGISSILDTADLLDKLLPKFNSNQPELKLLLTKSIIT